MSTRSSGDHRRLSVPEDTTASPRICCLCSKPNYYLSRPSQRDSEALAVSLQVELDSLVCKACRNDITKCLSDPKHTPRWKINISKPVCIVSDCHDKMEHNCSIYSSDELHVLLVQTGLQVNHPPPVPTPLCQHHYNVLYETYQQRQMKCVACDTWLRYTTSRVCTHPKEFEKILRETTDFQGTINPEDKVCIACYRAHLIKLDKASDSEIRISTDDELQSLISSVMVM